MIYIRDFRKKNKFQLLRTLEPKNKKLKRIRQNTDFFWLLPIIAGIYFSNTPPFAFLILVVLAIIIAVKLKNIFYLNFAIPHVLKQNEVDIEYAIRATLDPGSRFENHSLTDLVDKELQLRLKQKHRKTSAWLALLLGGLGVQWFYMRKTSLGVLCVFFCWTSIPMLIGVITGIIWLCMSDELWEN